MARHRMGYITRAKSDRCNADYFLRQAIKAHASAIDQQCKAETIAHYQALVDRAVQAVRDWEERNRVPAERCSQESAVAA